MKKSRVFVYLIVVISAFMINFYYRPVNNKVITDSNEVELKKKMLEQLL